MQTLAKPAIIDAMPLFWNGNCPCRDTFHGRRDGKTVSFASLQIFPLRGCSSVDRVLASEAKGRGFDPRQPHQIPSVRPSQALTGQAALPSAVAPALLSSRFVHLSFAVLRQPSPRQRVSKYLTAALHRKRQVIVNAAIYLLACFLLLLFLVSKVDPGDV
jgi:hypothetical protein